MRGLCVPATPISSSFYHHHRPSLIGSIIAVHVFRRSLLTVRSSDPKLADRHYHYEKNATKYWDNFYKRHQNKFFKDRHYLKKDWGQYFADDDDSVHLTGKVALEVGCGAGNTIFPLLAAYPKLYVHACDFSPHAIDLVKSHEAFREDRVNAFVCNVTDNDLSENIPLSSVDVVTLIFMLSAVSPKKMHSILQNVKKILKPNGYVLVRDYAIGDFAQVKLQDRNQMIGENFYVRGDGTCSFYFSEDFLTNLFTKVGFSTVDINIYCKQIENRSRNITMDRWGFHALVIQSVGLKDDLNLTDYDTLISFVYDKTAEHFWQKITHAAPILLW